MSGGRALVAVLAPVLLGGCLATKRDLRDVRVEMETLRSSQEQLLREVQRQNAVLLDSMSRQNVRTRGDLSNRLLQIDRQLVQIQELTGQGQQQVSELRRQISQRAQEMQRASEPDQVAPAEPSGAPGTAEPEELYNTSLAALRRGSAATARAGFEEFLRVAPTHRLAADAHLGIGDSYAERDPARAIQSYSRVAELYPSSPRAATALLRAGMLEATQGKSAEARVRFNRVIRAYPRSPEVTQARQELQKLGTQ